MRKRLYVIFGLLAVFLLGSYLALLLGEPQTPMEFLLAIILAVVTGTTGGLVFLWLAFRWYVRQDRPSLYVDPGDAGLVDEPPDDRIKAGPPPP
jgi:hypothetical protein